MAVGDPDVDGPSGVGIGAGTGGGDFGFGDVGQQVAAANAQAAAAAQAAANAQAAQAQAEAEMGLDPFGGPAGYSASPSQVAAEAAMGLDPFGGSGVTAGFMGPDGTQGMERILPEVLAPQPVCPEGYEYDANLQACRKITMSPMDQLQYIQPATAMTPRYAMMGLLDQAPMGLLEAGFGAPADFTAKNLAFRRQSASVPTYFSDPRSYEGYTLI
jgi:hypothetical protein